MRNWLALGAGWYKAWHASSSKNAEQAMLAPLEQGLGPKRRLDLADMFLTLSAAAWIAAISHIPWRFVKH